jgi:hypothetical protein
MSGAVYVSVRVEDLPVPYVTSSTRRACERCSEAVWIDPGTFAAAMFKEGREPLVLCSDCAGELGETLR